ncbi:uncharacterized protein LOC110708611 isoform X2 [Chenopodium quinoa]|uniref:uncharacterized protein LOC110708611 isoform X2 n=1 Tax=Chenopodium quinoa TaxID=63459 RepID=UPI000B79A905|nr:uncharacterized protein LOC110708611 isoform X2 [Chenopodium quinoa]
MAEHEEDGFSFGDFKFATPPPPSHLQPQPQSQINGVTSTSNIADVWGDFFFNPSPPQSTPSQSQFNLPDNNGFSSSFNWAQPVSGPSPIRVDPGPTKPAIGASPLSLFGEVDPNPNTQSNGNFDFTGFNMNFNGVASDLSIENGNKKNDNNEEEDEDEWEFKGAFSGNSVTEQGNSKDGSVVSKSKIELSMKKEQEKQDASQFVDHKLGVNGLGPQSIDFFAAPYENETNHQSSEMAVGIKSNASTTNGFMWDPFPEVELIDNGGGISASSMNQDDDFDDFGDFIDASREVVSKEQQEQVGNDVNPAEVQLPNGEAQEKQTQTKHSRGALPLSLFCDDSEESSDSLNLQNEVAQMPTLNPVNSFSGQKPAISIKDLVSNLYSEAQLTSSVDSTVKPAENGVHSPPKAAVTTSLDEDDDWDDDSWEFKGAYSDNGVGEQLSTAIPGNVAQKQLPELQIYIDFYDELRGSLCFLLSCQLDELKKARSSDVNGNGGKAEALDDEMQEVSKLLEEKMISKEVFSKKDLERSTCLDKFLDVLQGPNFNVIEAEFSLTKKLQLAVSDWRVTAELLRHAISMLKVLLLGTADDQSLYVLTWSKVINVCVQELSHGASIWKRASEKNVQHQILSDSRGQQFIQALGEIYKVVEILGLSAKVYKQWILLSPSSDPSQFFSVLFECGALWVNSGLERALQNLSDGIDFQCNESAKTLVTSITNIRDIDVVAVHDRVFREHKSICRLSLLPQEIMADLKTVTWGEKPYFLNLANLWENLISSTPPQLPNLQIS